MNDPGLEGFGAPEDVLGIVGEDAQPGQSTLTLAVQACLISGSR